MSCIDYTAGQMLRGHSQENISGRFPLILGVFLFIFRLLQQEQIHLGDLNPELSINTPMSCYYFAILVSIQRFEINTILRKADIFWLVSVNLMDTFCIGICFFVGFKANVCNSLSCSLTLSAK